MKSVMTTQQRFSEIEGARLQRSTFDRSHGHKTTLDAGKLYPIFVDEALPGDTFTLSPTIFGRIATPLKPIMDNIFVDVHFFSVPNRLLWDNWQKFMGEQENPGDSTDYLIPTMQPNVGGYPELSIYDYFGLPTKVDSPEHSALPLRAYNLIWNEWYRDENLQDSIPINKGDGPDDTTDYSLEFRGKRKDYFTSALPWAQKADPISIPLGDQAPVYGRSMSSVGGNTNGNLWQTYIGGSGDVTGFGTVETGTDPYSLQPNSSDWSEPVTPFQSSFSLGTEDQYEGTDNQAPYADLTQATAVTINQLRQAATIQQMYERDARGGTRYTELIKSHFGVTSPDARLQRPEFLGGGSSPLTMNPIPQQSATTDGVTPQGNLAAMGTMNISQKGFTKTFTEHEIVIGLISIRADLTYQHGMNRMWSRSTRFDFFWPSFAHLGEQAILNKEIYASGDKETDNEVFGYQERFAEYRYKPSQITGLFRSNADQSLDFWHLSQDFETPPSLNSTFIEENPPIARTIAVPSEPQFIIDCYFDFKTARPMPVYSTPGIDIL